MKTKTIFTEKFQEVYDDGNKQMYIRKFGKVILDDDKEINLLCIAEIYDLDRSGAVREDELETNEKGEVTPVMLTFHLLPEYENVSEKHKASATSCGCGGNFEPLIDIVDYMGGLRFEPSEKVWFKTNASALRHLRSKELKQQISGQGMLSGFIMDQHYNRIGETNWDILNKIMNGK